MSEYEAGLPLVGDLGEVMAAASGLLLSDEKVAEALPLITQAAKLLFPDAAGAGASLMDRNAQRVSLAASDSVVDQADEAQYRLEEGPCLTAWATGETVVVQNIAADPRWPRWSQAVAPLGLFASISAPMLAGGEAFGAVKVYSDRPWEFSENARRVLELLAQQAAFLLVHAHSIEEATRISTHLADALSSRNVIALAQGMLMDRHSLDERAAVRRLIDLATLSECSLLDAARRLVGRELQHFMETDGEDGQLSGLQQAFRVSELDVGELWIKYFALGGGAGQLEIEAYLAAALHLPALERDLLAQTLNEHFLNTNNDFKAPFSDG